MNNLLIYGPPASGKSYIGKKLAQMFNVQFIDLDAEIESRTEDNIEDIISMLGEKGFRNVESDILEDVLFSNDNAIIALGGGALLKPESRKIAELENTVICLDWDKKDLEHNFLKDDKDRPLCKWKDVDEYRKLLEQREQHYKSFDYQLTNLFLDPDCNAQNGLSNIFIGKTYVNALAMMIKTFFKNSKISVIYDKNVSNVALQIVDQLKDAEIYSGLSIKLKTSEKMKDISTVKDILNKLDDIKANRNDVLISIGGGITSDIVGFAASLWKRGMKWINIPTTLLSMVDASVGGKTGVNFNNAKNILGSFYKPACVFIDYRFLLTLKKEQIAEGYAEAYKHYLLDDNVKNSFDENGTITVVDLLQQIGKEPSFQDYSDQKVIAKFLNTKVKTVAKDPFEKSGLRAKLNLGHTIAHALEIKTNYKISHGHAVSIGICEELRLSKANGLLKDAKLLDKVVNDFTQLGLPTQFPKGISFESLVEIMHKDKKNESDKIKFILLEEQGKTVEYFIQ